MFDHMYMKKRKILKGKRGGRGIEMSLALTLFCFLTWVLFM